MVPPSGQRLLKTVQKLPEFTTTAGRSPFHQRNHLDRSGWICNHFSVQMGTELQTRQAGNIRLHQNVTRSAIQA